MKTETTTEAKTETMGATGTRAASGANERHSNVRGVARAISVAPMMDRTDRHYRYFMRQISRHALLYTEMLTTGAVLNGDRQRLLSYSDIEHPLAIQLGGDDATALAECARIARDWGYDEVNLNVGCPSERVQSGSFGACLMARPSTVARAVEAMRAAVDIPITVKHRIGIDDLDRYEDMANFVAVVARAGADRFSVHARKAWLKGLSPKENRTIPPLRYPDVYRLKREFPELVIEINGGIRDLDRAAEHLERVDAVMIGRAAYEEPWIFADVDRRFFGRADGPEERSQVVVAMLSYIDQQLQKGERLHRLTRHMIHLYAGIRGARAWRRYLSTHSSRPGAGPEVVSQALAAAEQARRPAPPRDRTSGPASGSQPRASD